MLKSATLDLSTLALAALFRSAIQAAANEERSAAVMLNHYVRAFLDVAHVECSASRGGSTRRMNPATASAGAKDF